MCCEICGNTFTDKGALKKHILLVHEGLQNYSCDLCGKSYGERDTLRRHIKGSGS